MTPHLTTLDQLHESDDDDANCRLTGSAHALKPFWALPTALVDECRLEVGETLSAQFRDPANVAEGAIELFPAALDSWDAPADSFEIGLLLDELGTRFNHVRSGKRTADGVTLDLTPTATELAIEREYESATAERRDILRSIDPDVVRQLDDGLTGAGLEFTASATVGVPVLADTIDYLDRVDSNVGVAHEGDDLLLGNEQTERDDDGERTTAGHETRVKGVAYGDEVSATYSLDYLSDIIKGIHSARIETIDLQWGDEFPLHINAVRIVDGETWYSADFWIAPRIEGGDSA